MGRTRVLLQFAIVLLLLNCAHADSVTVGYFSFSSDTNGNATFQISNLTNTAFGNGELDYRLQLGGVAGGAISNVAPAGQFDESVPGDFFQWGYFQAGLQNTTFLIGNQSYEAQSTNFSTYLYSDVQFYLGPGQNVQTALVVNASPVSTPEPSTFLLLLGAGLPGAALLRARWKLKAT